MTAVPLPLRFQIGARTLVSIQRKLVRVPMNLDDVLDGHLPALPPLDGDADGYQITSLPEERQSAMIQAGSGMIAFVRQRYTRYYADLTLGYDGWLGMMSSNARSGMKRKAKKIATLSGGTLDVRRFRTPDEMTAFHDVARQVSIRTYQEKLLGSGLPDDAAFVARMYSMAAADSVRGWLLHIAGEPAAYLYCPIVDGTVRYEYVGHDPAFNDLSPGSVLHMEAMRDLYAEGGLKRFDFTEGEGQHKRQFATGGVACLDLLLLRASLANRLTTMALGTFDRTMAWAKTATRKLGLGELAKKIRRA
ncbi:GNAT family N-acetyltransferase [Sphingomonas sp. So64.6b]|uniref:GNAT family N-acetyltransferase n=1 Tax=Sphingomonas sp. So64.6b TaxID=2997354 RepID=UPI00160255C5|nr:GNAT family N-acetyltransferase [Sphingomonas sp. So64.6b]QNA84821.1 GNAT family N-acetyltransferase [Sphingomonas sp. So64.6b]